MMTPEDKGQSVVHIICEGTREKHVPLALQSDSTFDQLYKSSIRYKSSELSLSITFARFEYPFCCQKLDGKCDRIDCIPDDATQHDVRKAANDALKKALFDE